MRYHSLTVGLLFLILAGVLETNPGEASRASAAYVDAMDALDLRRPISLTAGCVSCPQCGGGLHGLVSGAGKLMIYPGDPHFGECVPADCMSFHYWDYECGDDSLTDDEQEAIWSAATGEDLQAMVDALIQFPDVLRLNTHRLSLQVYNCQGDIAANIPLLPSRFALLRSALKA